MKILYIVMKYNMGHPEQGYSYEHYNFYDSLVRMDNSKHEIIYFPFDEILLKHGRDKMNDLLIEKVNTEKPDICFFELITHQIKPDTIRKITESGKTITFNWFSDDEWRFEIFSKHYAPLFDWISTTDFRSVGKYHKMGYKNVIKTTWGCNQFLYKPSKSASGKRFEHDVTFVGKAYGNRPHMIDAIKNAKINVDCWGGGWSNGRIPQKDMIKLFNQSKVNLNFSQTPRNLNPTYILGILFNREINNQVYINSPNEWIPRIKFLMHEPTAQIHARLFEIPACGGFMLAEQADKIEDYYTDGKEIAVFKNEHDLIQKIEYYLNENKERTNIANAGYKRTIKEHTYEKRFRNIFNQIGL